MGYTHYWTFKPAPKGLAKQAETKYQKAVEECTKVIQTYYKEYGGLSGYTAHTKDYGGLNVNGKGDQAHETFAMREHYSQNIDKEGYNSGFNFCKTARKPYDLVVVACLSIMKYQLGDLIDVQSDGDSIDWYDGVEYANKVLKRKVLIPASIRRPNINWPTLVTGGAK